MFLEFIKRKEAQKFNEDLAQAATGYDLTQVGLVEDKQIYKIVINPEAKRTVAFVAGIHGDEVAGPYGVLKFLESKFYVPETKKVVIIPLANPTGFEKGTRRNADDKDINRHFLEKELKDECKLLWDALKGENVELLHTLHEDPDLKNFYLYYTHHKKLAEDLRELGKRYFDILPEGERISAEEKEGQGDKVKEGMIPLPHVVRGSIEDKFLIELAVPYITTESPGKAKLDKRIEFNKNAMKMVINSF